jgi:hypothetical protein
MAPDTNEKKVSKNEEGRKEERKDGVEKERKVLRKDGSEALMKGNLSINAVVAMLPQPLPLLPQSHSLLFPKRLPTP